MAPPVYPACGVVTVGPAFLGLDTRARRVGSRGVGRSGDMPSRWCCLPETSATVALVIAADSGPLGDGTEGGPA
jgi:hypothetical protein